MTKLNNEQALAVAHREGPCLVTAVPGSGKCITGDSWVFSNDCLLSPIQDNNLSSVLSLSDEDLKTVRIEPKKVRAFVNSGVKPVIQILTHHGFSICGTKHHPIVILSDRGELAWKQLSQIRIGDFAAIWSNKNCKTYASVDRIDHPNLTRSLNPSKLDYSYYLMGLLLGGGSLLNPQVESFSCKEKLESLFVSLIEQIYGTRVSEWGDKQYENLWNLNVDIKSDLIGKFGDIEHSAYDKYLTPQMLSGDKYQIAALIRGIFYTNAYASENFCEITLCSKKLIDQLHLLLLHFGVFAYKKEKTINDNKYYLIRICGENYGRFLKNIGFGGILYKKENSNKARNLEEISALKIVDIYDQQKFQSNTISYLRGIAENLCFSKVVDVSSIIPSIQEEHVYDYEVAESHSFIANGFINHNTRVLTERVISLVKTYDVEPKNILCLTFTNKAANEMKQRIAEKLGVQAANIWISTFHKLCLEILRKHGSLINLPSNFSVYASKEQEELMAKLARIHQADSSKFTVQRLCKVVNDFREDIVNYEQYIQELNHIEGAIVDDYQETLDQLNAVDFSGMLYKTWLILKNNPAVGQSLSNRFQYVLIDEFQDTNHVQYDIVKRIALHKNIFVVGDFQQCVRKGQEVLVGLSRCGTVQKKRVEQVNVGDQVISAGGNGRLVACTVKDVRSHTSFVSETYIRTKSGNELKTTSNHQMFVRRNVCENTLAESKTSIVSTLLGDSQTEIKHKYSIRSSDSKFINAFEHETGISFKRDVRHVKRIDGSKKDLYQILDLVKISSDVAALLNSPIQIYKKAQLVSGKSLDVVSASSLVVGDSIPIYCKNHIRLDEIVEIKTYSTYGTYYDFEIEGSHNFITEGIVHSNSIYGWRGAKPENLKNFKEDYENVTMITLPRNYRSTKQILQAAQNLIRNNDDATDVELHSDRDGPAVYVHSMKNPEEEASAVAQRMIILRNKAGYDWKDFAILYRANSLSRSPELALRSRSIPYRIIGGFSFFDRSEIKTAISYLSFLANPYDSINFARAITNPKRGIGNDTIGKLEKVCEHTKESIVDALRSSALPKMSSKAKMNLGIFLDMIEKYRKMQGEKPLSEIIKGLLQESGYYDYLVKMDKDEYSTNKSRVENLDEFISGIAEFESRRSNVTIADYLQSIQLLTSEDKDDLDNEDSVKLLTIHSAKGLEWPCVFIIGVERGFLPHAKAEMERGVEEERRLLYVAMTRARDLLLMSHCNIRRQHPTGPSCFLDEIR